MKALLLQSLDLADVMNRVNALIHDDVDDSGNFVTVFVLACSPDTRRASWVSAGHDPAWFQPFGGGRMRTLGGRDIPVGVDPEWRYTEFSEELGSGVLVMGTDGIWEAGVEQEGMFGKERLFRVIRDNAHLPPQDLASRILEAVEAFTGAGRVEDDRTLVIARLA
jgi:sigma-B regulation protein RsbU (phosphoserine phosphatase)